MDYQPYNYNLNLPTPLQNIMQGYQAGAAIQQNQLNQQQQQLQLAQQQRMQDELRAVSNNPTPQAIAALTVRYPQFKDAFKQAHDQMDDNQRQDAVNFASQFYAAGQAGNTDLQRQMVNDRIEAAKNSNQDAGPYEQIKKYMDVDPKYGQYVAGTYLASVMDPKNFANTFKAVGEEERAKSMQPFEQQKAQAGLAKTQAETYATYGDLQLKKSAQDIERLKVQLQGETNQLEREKLRNQIAVQERDFQQKSADRQAEASSSIGSFDTALNTVRQLKAHPGLSAAVGAYGAIPNFPGSDASNAQALIDQLQSQSFLSQVEKMRGLGALTEAEGAKLNNAIGTLNTKQDEKQFRNQLNFVEKMMEKGRANMVKKYGAQGSDLDTGGVVWANHPKFGQLTQGRINSLASQMGITPEEFIDRAKRVR